MEQICDFMLIAKVLQLQSLSEGISQLLIENLTIENVVPIYEIANEYGRTRLKKVCESFIDKHAEILVARKSLIQLSAQSLKEIIARDSCRIRTVEIVKLIRNWRECHYNRTILTYSHRVKTISDEELIRLEKCTEMLTEVLHLREERFIELRMQANSKTTAMYLKVFNNKLASGSDDKTIKIWNVHTGECIRTLIGHSHYVLSLHLIFSNYLASGSFDNSIKIWNIESGECLNTLTGHTKAVYALQLLPDSSLASGSDDQTIKIWNVNSGRCIRTLSGHTSFVYALQLLPNNTLASASDDKTIRIWNHNSGECIRTLTGHSSGVFSLQSIGYNKLASGSWDSKIKIWNVTSGECVRTIHVYSLKFGPVYSLQLLANKTLASGSWGKRSLKLWNTKTGECIRTIDAQFYAIRSLALLADNKLASGSNCKLIKIWNVHSGECIRTLAGHKASVTCLQAL